MMHAEQCQCVLYTLSDSPLPVYSVHLSCEGILGIMACTCKVTDCYLVCEINYHYNFKVFKGKHTYFGGIPDIIQISEHQFVK